MGTEYQYKEIPKTYKQLRKEYVDNYIITDENLNKINISEDLIDFFTIDGKMQEKSIILILKFSD
jgi:hypothetical protein